MTRITGGQPTAQGTSCMPGTLHPPWQEDEVLERRTGERGASAVSTAVIDAAPQRRSGVGWESMTQIQRSEEHTSELQSRGHLVCRLLLEKKKTASKSAQKTNAA